MDPDNDGAYTASAVRCHACAEQVKAMTEFKDDDGDMDGLFWSVRRQSR